MTDAEFEAYAYATLLRYEAREAERVAKKRKSPRTNECGIARDELRKMPVSKRTRPNEDTGTVEGLCTNCPCAWRSIRSAFLPDETKERNMRAHAELTKALDAYELAVTNGTSTQAQVDALYDTIVSKRTSECSECLSKHKLSPVELACKAEWERMKREACAKHGGCSNPDCPERGMSSWTCMSADHIVSNPTENHDLSDYMYWSHHGGVPAMRKEWEKVKFLCFCCHHLRPTSKAGRGWSEEEKKRAPNQYKIVKEKQDYVDARKVAIGACQYPECNRKVTLETARAFPFDHTDPSTKATHESHPNILYKGEKGVSGMVNNLAKRAALHVIQPQLDAEMAKCNLYCHNCHSCRKPTGRARWDES